MTPELLALARHRLDRAHATFADGVRLLDAGSAEGAINRLYYASFHAARAVLALRQMDSPKHSGVITLFQLHFVKTGIIPPTTGKVLARSFEKRQKSDYADFAQPTLDEAAALCLDVEALIQACAAIVEGFGGDQEVPSSVRAPR